MKASVILEEIHKLEEHGETSYENCEKLVLLHKALKCLEGGAGTAAYVRCGTDEHLTKAQVAAWVGAMKNADGTHGGHWSMEQTEAVRKQRGIECDPVMFYAAMNMMYSDYCKAVEKASACSLDLYAYMAKAFLDDEGAAPDELERYYYFVAVK